MLRSPKRSTLGKTSHSKRHFWRVAPFWTIAAMVGPETHPFPISSLAPMPQCADTHC